MKKNVLSKELKKYRQLNDKTQSDMAKLIGVSLTGYQMWERGISNPKKENLSKILKIIK